MRYPSSWTSNEDRKDRIWYRYFLPPGQGAERRPPAAATLLVGPLPGTLDEYAQSYLEGNQAPLASREFEKDGARGKDVEYLSGDGSMRYRLFLVADPPRVYGLYAQSPASSWESQRGVLDALVASLTLERPARYPVIRDESFGFSLGIPPSWRETRRFASKDTLLLQFATPALAMDRGRQAVRASLTVSVEPAPEPDDVQAYYDATLKRLGDAFKVASHDPWKAGNGFVDVMLVESAMSESRIKRYFAVRGARAYSLSFESREDVFPRFHRWADYIASTFATH